MADYAGSPAAGGGDGGSGAACQPGAKAAYQSVYNDELSSEQSAITDLNTLGGTKLSEDQAAETASAVSLRTCGTTSAAINRIVSSVASGPRPLFGLVRQARERIWSGRDSTPCRTRTCRPRPAGEHAEQTAPRAGVAPRGRLTRALARPLDATSDALMAVAAGDLTQRVDVRGRDEMARMGTSLNQALGKMSRTVAGIDESVSVLASSSEELAAVSQQLASGAEETSAQALR